MGRLSHPGIVAIYEYGEDDGTAFIAMEYVEGQTLSALLAATPQPDEPMVVRVMAQVLFHERRHEVVAVVVAIAHAQLQRLPGGGAGGAQQLGLELHVEELIARALVDEDPGTAMSSRDQLDGVVVAAVPAEKFRERLLSPGHL